MAKDIVLIQAMGDALRNTGYKNIECAMAEIIDNSIQAEAKDILIIVSEEYNPETGRNNIKEIGFLDNGKGMDKDDAVLAFSRHATSKIRSAEDLSTVKSMGFRGEALASIAAISRVELVSKTATQANGQKIVVEGGNIIEKSETGACVGTTITVTNLFYNTPVRYKFLRKDFTEAGYIEDAVSRIALAHPEIALKLINTGRTVIQTNGNGDIKTKEDALRMFKQTGVDGIMIGRGAIGNPWIFEQIKYYLENNKKMSAPTNKEKYEIIKEHLELNLKEKGNVVGINEMRKHISAYTKNMPEASRFRDEINHITDVNILMSKIQEFFIDIFDKK